MCVWAEKQRLEHSPTAPENLFKGPVLEFQKKCDATRKSLLMDVRNYDVCGAEKDALA